VVSAELSVRRTGARAALADFGRWYWGEIIPGDWQSWSFRLAAELRSLIASIDDIPAGDPVLVLAEIGAFFDAFDWQNCDLQAALERTEEIVNGDGGR
jgi:hypothetical protein